MGDLKVIICGKDCDDCIYSTINDNDKARVKVFCAIKGKEYYYGQSVQCEDKKKK